MKSLGFFRDSFLEYLKGFRFKGDVYSVREGEVVFPLEPLVRVEGSLLETQLIETLLLNFLNFESLVATKASRMVLSARGRRVVDFGLRRAQGLAGIAGLPRRHDRRSGRHLQCLFRPGIRPSSLGHPGPLLGPEFS